MINLMEIKLKTCAIAFVMACACMPASAENFIAEASRHTMSSAGNVLASESKALASEGEALAPESNNQHYQPSPENLESRKEFQDDKFGIFLHWGLYSMLATGEWTMTNKDLNYKEYAKLAGGFYPSHFDAVKWVAAIKASGAKYICFTTRHHEGFSMFKTKYSDYNIVDATPSIVTSSRNSPMNATSRASDSTSTTRISTGIVRMPCGAERVVAQVARTLRATGRATINS